MDNNPTHPTHEEMLEEAFWRESGWDDWFYAEEGWGFRSERFHSDLETSDVRQRRELLLSWLRQAFIEGYEAGSRTLK